MGRIIPYMIWKIKNVWNHQPVIYDSVWQYDVLYLLATKPLATSLASSEERMCTTLEFYGWKPNMVKKCKELYIYMYMGNAFPKSISWASTFHFKGLLDLEPPYHFEMIFTSPLSFPASPMCHLVPRKDLHHLLHVIASLPRRSNPPTVGWSIKLPASEHPRAKPPIPTRPWRLLKLVTFPQCIQQQQNLLVEVVATQDLHCKRIPPHEVPVFYQVYTIHTFMTQHAMFLLSYSYYIYILSYIFIYIHTYIYIYYYILYINNFWYRYTSIYIYLTVTLPGVYRSKIPLSHGSQAVFLMSSSMIWRYGFLANRFFSLPLIVWLRKEQVNHLEMACVWLVFHGYVEYCWITGGCVCLVFNYLSTSILETLTAHFIMNSSKHLHKSAYQT